MYYHRNTDLINVSINYDLLNRQYKKMILSLQPLVDFLYRKMRLNDKFYSAYAAAGAATAASK